MDRRMRDSAAVPIYLFLLVYTTVYAFIPGVDGPISNQEALEDGNTTFYCDTTPETAGDELMILVWYKNKLPIYSYDAGIGSEWTSPLYSGRLKTDLQRQPTSLTISELKQYDQAVYHCRVDFAFSPTRNLGVNLTVVVLPSQPFFQDEMDNPVEDKIGPYHEGDTLVLRCLVIGGHPPPRISWYSGETLVDASDGANEVPRIRDNELYLPLTRENAAALSCRASNTHLRPPVVATLQIELFLPAYNVSMHWVEGTIDSTLQAGKPAVIRCQAYGSYPSPKITWWLDDREITSLSNQTWNNSTQTAISYLRLTPSIMDNGGTLTCNATNPVMAPNRGSKADVITLNVTYSPIVGISKLGTGSLNEIVELDPLHLKCEITANPPPDKIAWFFNDVEITPGEIWGDNTSSTILFVDEATRHHTGRYSCSARNHVGENRSKHLSITVFFPPECADIGILLINESLYCNVVALPVPDTFFWHVQPSGFDVQAVTNASPILSLTQITGPLSGPLKARCEAGNGVASQEKPCENTFSLESLRPPQPKQCDLDFEHGEFQMICVPVEHATYYEVSVWRMSTTNSSLLLERRGTMGFGGHALAAGGGVWLVRGSLGRLKAGDEAGAAACNRYGCSRALLLRPTEASLSLASPPWWHFIMEKDVGISIGAVILVAVFLISTPLIIRLARRPRSKPPAPVIQVLQLDDVARDYLDTIGEHKVHASCSIRSCSSVYSDGSVDSTAPPVDRRRKPRALWDQWDPPPDVTLTLHRESAV